MNFTRRTRQQQLGPPFDVNTLEEEIRSVMPTRPALATVEYLPRNYEPESQLETLEQPQVTAQDLGKITAEAIGVAHEAAAASLASLGKELADRMAAIEKLKLEMQEAMKSCLDVAEQYRSSGKLASDQIEKTSALTAEVVDVCTSMRKKLAPQ